MPKVLIVGAGLSGLTAAYELSKSGKYEITILEELGTVGGRIQSIKINNVSINIGGFIIFPWYKYLRNLLKELGLEDKLIRFDDIKNYWFIDNKFVETKELDWNISLIQKRKILFKILPFLLSFEKFFYMPSGKSESLSAVLAKFVDTNHTLFKITRAFFEGFTYQSIDKISFRKVISVLLIMGFRGSVEKSSMLESTDDLILALKDQLKNRKVIIDLNSKVKSIDYKKIKCVNGNIYEFDKLVLATPHLEYVKKIIGVGEIESTHYYTIIAEFENSVKINNENWTSSFHEPLNKDYEITSMVNLEWMSCKKLNDRFIMAYLKSKSKSELVDEEIRKIVSKEMNKLLPDNKLKKIHSATFWENNMPIIDEEQIEVLRKMQGKDNIYFTGDFLSFPSMETAVYNAIKVSNLIRKI